MLTVTTLAAKQPVAGNVYVMRAVPTLTPVMIPEEPTAATAVLLLLHVPPDVELTNVVVFPTLTVCVPLSEFGLGFPVITIVV